jgi:hypothetical protein
MKTKSPNREGFLNPAPRAPVNVPKVDRTSRFFRKAVPKRHSREP